MSVIQLVRMLDSVDPGLRNILLGILEEMERQNHERVTRTEVQELRDAVLQLTEAQKRTEERLDALAKAQAQTEIRINELAAAQKRTEERLEQLACDHQSLRDEVRALAKQVGGLSNTLGYGFEDRIMPFVPDYARKVWGLEVRKISRTNVEYPDGRYDEVNILAEAVDTNGSPVFVVGECKVHPGKRDAGRFQAMLQRLQTVLPGTIIPLFIGASFSPEAERDIRQHFPHFTLAKTYEIELIARGIAS